MGGQTIHFRRWTGHAAHRACGDRFETKNTTSPDKAKVTCTACKALIRSGQV